MKKLIAISMPIKAFAAMVFAGIMILYMVSSVAYGIITGEAAEYAIPFVFVVQGALLATVISALWSVFLGDALIKKWRFSKRLIMFKLSLVPFLALCFFTFLAIPDGWTMPWFISILAVSVFVVILAMLSEVYFKKTGERYTEALKQYKERTSQEVA
ncbi:MAG: hypothetical protein FWF79_01510 [Defluviitaleaceae bacterium]|nr:hypothetical protein [Defluviitaleaceae bacterium]